jgi:hypothetical protein
LGVLHRNKDLKRVVFPMGLFKPDLYRSLAIGFVLGAVVVFSVLGIDPGQKIAQGVAPQAEAASAQ